MSQDPPPDLAIEIDITSSSINRLKLYAALGVPEVWRYDGQTLLMYRLENKDYLVCDRSLAFFLLTPADLERFLDLKKTTKENALVQRFREWVRERLAVEEYLSSNKTAIAINHDRSPLNP